MKTARETVEEIVYNQSTYSELVDAIERAITEAVEGRWEMSFLNVAKRIDFLDAEIKRLEDEKRELISRQQRACSHPSDERESDGYYQSWEQNWVNLGWRCKICGLYQKERAE